jgi:N utilization substance protein A
MQLSLAIGKQGQHVRLGSKLVGWNIDIKSEEEKRQEIEAQMAALTAPTAPLSELAGVGPKLLEKLEAHGITTIERLADMTPEQLLEIPGIGDKMVEKIRNSVAAHFENLEAQQLVAQAAGAEADLGSPREGYSTPEDAETTEQPTHETSQGEDQAMGTPPDQEGPNTEPETGGREHAADPSAEPSQGGEEQN